MEQNIKNTYTAETVYIPVEEIWQHPDNPRKNLGDLTELSESVKKKGIMQNLTVIPGHWDQNQQWHEQGYTLIIGHRRCAAAKLAGIKELPCRIVRDMSHKDQVAMMLEENMQRNDLTIWEQANGFQMMLDLGTTEEEIAEKTGFSKTTIRRRLNIAKLDQGVLRKKEQDDSFQLSLKDLYELEKIKDVKTRNKVLKEAGDSRQLVWRAKEAAREEKRGENKKQFEELFEKAGIPKAPKSAESERYDSKWHICQKWELDKETPPKTMENFGKGAMWVVFWGETIAVITPSKKQKRELSPYEIERQETTKIKKELRQRHKALYDSMGRFIKKLIAGEIPGMKEEVELYRSLIETLMDARVSFSRGNLSEVYAGKGLADLAYTKENQEEYQSFLEWEKKLSPLHTAIAQLYSVRGKEMHDYYARYHEENTAMVKAVVDFLTKYGFCISEEEQRMIDGTHELYRKGDTT